MWFYMMQLKTNRLFIKPPNETDLSNWFDLHADPDVMYYVSGSCQPDTIKRWMQADISHYQKHGFCLGSVFEKTNNEFVGRAGIVFLNYDDAQPELEIGYILSKKHWNKGYGTELVKGLIEWGFNYLNVSKLVAVTHPENKRSQHVLEKSGMRFAKRIQYYDDQCDFYEIYNQG